MLDGAEETFQPAPKGLYMFGGVGTGKTMLMDLLVESAPTTFKVRSNRQWQDVGLYQGLWGSYRL